MSTQSSTEWRSKPPSAKQIALANKLGITSIPATSGEISDLIKGKTPQRTSSQGRSFSPKPMTEITVPLSETEFAKLEKQVTPVVLNLLGTLSVVREHCLKAGLDAPASIGMIFNKTCEKLSK